MFSGCSSLTSLDLSGFDTSNVELMSSMFYGCTSLESVDLSSFDTANVRIMYGAFRDYSSLESLDLSGFDTSSVFDADEALAGCISLTSVKVGPKTLANLSLPSEDVDGHADWYSEDADRWFTSEQIDAGRKTFSDVYMKSAPQARQSRHYRHHSGRSRCDRPRSRLHPDDVPPVQFQLRRVLLHDIDCRAKRRHCRGLERRGHRMERARGGHSGVSLLQLLCRRAPLHDLCRGARHARGRGLARRKVANTHNTMYMRARRRTRPLPIRVSSLPPRTLCICLSIIYTCHVYLSYRKAT